MVGMGGIVTEVVSCGVLVCGVFSCGVITLYVTCFVCHLFLGQLTTPPPVCVPLSVIPSKKFYLFSKKLMQQTCI